MTDSDGERQRVTLSLTRGRVEVLREEAKRRGFTISRGPDAGEGNVSQYIDALAWDIQNRRSKMELQRVHVGWITVQDGGSGEEDDSLAMDVEFKAACIAENEVTFDAPDVPFESYSHSLERLYRTDDARYIIHRMDFADSSEPLEVWGTLIEVSEEDLGLGGEYRDLGRLAGIDKTLTLDEALAQQDAILDQARKRIAEE